MKEIRLISDIPAVQEHYEYCLLIEGCSERLAEMLAWQQPPCVMTDSIFMEGSGSSQWGAHPQIGDLYKKEAAAAGVDVTGARYLHGLAAFPGDPKAWVRSRGDVQRVCEERGWGCRGAVNVQAQEPREQPKQNTPVADDIVQAEVQRSLAADPGLALRPAEEVREQVTERLRPQWTRKKTPRRPLADRLAA